MLAQLQLRAAGVEPYTPRTEIIRRRWGRRVTMIEPLFPNYLFLRMSVSPSVWDAVRWTPGVRRLLGDGERPLQVHDDVIEAIRARSGELGFVRVGSRLRCGQHVRVLEGPLAGLEGIFERQTSRTGRVRVLMQVLGHSTPVEVEEINLEVA